jgi:hypothetical protein
VSRLRRSLGRRGLALLVFSAVFALTGLRVLVAPLEDEGHFLLYAFLPQEVRAALWLIPAALGTVAAFRPTGRDTIGFSALIVPATVVTFSYLWSWVGFFAGATDYALGWSGAARWLLVLALILLVSGWKEADEPPPLHPEDESGAAE